MNQEENFQKQLDDLTNFLDSYWIYFIGIGFGILTALRSYMGGSECPSREMIDGKMVIITGASSGIGKETALELGRRGGHIILAVKDTVSGKEVADTIRSFPNGRADVKFLDLSSLKSVREFVDNLETDQVDILINNAGIAFHPFEKTEEDFEMHFVTNYLSHFLLTQLLLEKLKNSDQGRIMNVSAQAHAMSSIDFADFNREKKFTSREAFAQSKLALILMSHHMSSLLKDKTNITINSLDPGLVRGTRHMRRSLISSTYVIKTIIQPFMWLLLKSPIQGAQTSIYLSVSSDLSNQTGKYFSDCELKEPAENARDDNSAKELYEKSIELVKNYM